MADQETQLSAPPAIVQAWGLRERPVKGPWPSVSVRTIVEVPGALGPELRFGLDRVLDGIGALIERA